nr:hypothetical protein Iba_chr14dCG0970 [Ipomoea batatas]
MAWRKPTYNVVLSTVEKDFLGWLKLRTLSTKELLLNGGLNMEMGLPSFKSLQLKC